jgi:hypothetical protein
LADLLQCLILRKQQPEAALQQLDELAGRHIEGLRGLTKSIQDMRLRKDTEGIRAAIQQYDDSLERYVPGKVQGGNTCSSMASHNPGCCVRAPPVWAPPVWARWH